MKDQLIFGPPGCGKTYTLMEIIRKELESGTPPDRIGFVSFSRKAINEARERSGSAFNLSEKDTPFFRTLHSMGFRWLGMKTEEMIGKYDMNQIGMNMGMVFDDRDIYDADGTMLQSAKEGNKYLTLINRAAMRKVSLEQEFRDNADRKMHYPLLKKLDAIYTAYKAETGKYDFTDMIRLMVEQGTGPVLDVLIVDEAQDLTPLQWDQVAVLRQNAKRVFYAGDDDQAIFRWTGVDVKHMLGVTENFRVLDQSYRVPRAVHDLAAKLARHISVRQPKQWKPTAHDGSIHHYMNVGDVDMTEGSWTIMSRTSNNLRKIGEQLEGAGILYKINGRLSFKEDILDAMNIWETLQRGEFINVNEAEKLYSCLPKRGDDAMVKHGMAKTLKDVNPEKPITFNSLVEDNGLLADRNMRPEDVLKLSQEEDNYLKAIRRRGEITKEPRIKLSTIHRMKGGEDENIVLLNDMGYLPHKNFTEGDPDDEHRVFYTAVTRTKQNLHIVDTGSKHRYPL
jgi:superfamily I DNA/RNA helicase